MPLEEERCSSSGSRSFKKKKQKRIPQRGLGVAQLEKIRLEEQHKKNAVFAIPSIPFSSPSPAQLHLSLPNPVFKTSDLVPSLEFEFPIPSPSLHYAHHSSSIPSPSLLYAHDRSSIPSPSLHYVHDSSSQVASGSCGGYSFIHELYGTPKFKTSFQYYPDSQIESKPVWHLQKNQQTVQQPQQQQTSSLVNISTSSSCSSSVINLQMEPPSNQSYCSNYIPPVRHEEERTRINVRQDMVGMKRPRQFSLDELPGAVPFQCKLMPFHIWDESLSGLDLFKYDSQKPLIREVPWSSTAVHTVHDFHRRTKIIKENRDLDGDFLTLGPPTAYSNPKSKQSVPIPDAHFGECNPVQFKSREEESLFGFCGPGKQQQPFYSFLAERSTNLKDWRGVDSVDLNLKL
ncbi:uncharacterized protein LOC131247193 isoform X2 [Magnolia sinica]|uniref:uncharacterized protein LOC131247193 isoform X2 n=1 Tax=Magnolia sinica TaxID=86752 RepID=UPI00265A1489|nr:uncharacterized protein LOC131247193 isoform X2 [Magnolia sinica]